MSRKVKTIADAKGLAIHMLYRGEDPNAITLNDGNRHNTAGWGLTNFIEEYLTNWLAMSSPIDIIAVWDGGSHQRTYLYPDYKASRRERQRQQDPQIEEQIEQLQRLLKVLIANLGGINVLVDTVEADDVIPLICHGLRDDMKMVWTRDADLLQVSDENTYVNVGGMVERHEYQGIPLHLLHLHKSLVGDASDEYIGVRRFGPKAWEKLQEKYGIDGLEEIDACLRRGEYAAIEECLEADPCAELEHAYSNLSDWTLAYQLAGLHPEWCYGFTREGVKIEPEFYTRIPNADAVRKVLEAAGCPELLEKFAPCFPTQQLVTEQTLDAAFALLDEHLPKTPYFAFDYETYDPVKHQPFNEAMPATARAKGDFVDVLSQQLTGASFNFGANLEHTLYFPVYHRDTNNVDKSVIRDILHEVQNVLKLPILAHNSAFEEQVTKQCLGFDLQLPYCTRILASYADENRLEAHPSLKDLSLSWLNFKQGEFEDLLEACEAEDMSEVTGEQVLRYVCDDALVTAHLFKLLSLKCKMEGTFDFYKALDRAPVHVWNRGFEHGLKIDYARLSELETQDAELVDTNMEAIRAALTEHCTELNRPAAETFHAADTHARQQLLRAGGTGAEKIEVAEKELLERLVNATVYVPYREEDRVPEFLGTPTQLQKLAGHIGFDAEELPFNTVSAKALSLWITQAHEWDYKAQPGIKDPLVAGEFIALLGEAAAALKKRTGPEYEALVEFALTALPQDNRKLVYGDALNFNSPNQMQELLYCKLGLTVQKRTSPQPGSQRDVLDLPGSPSVDSDAMQLAMAEDCRDLNDWRRDVITKTVEVKAAIKRASMFYRPYPLWAHPRDGLIHPGIRNPGTITRRPSSSSPNILQVSKGPTRSMFIAEDPMRVLVALDFSGQELRITGSESRDPVLIEAYTGGGTYIDDYGMQRAIVKDVHSVTATAFMAEILGAYHNSQGLQRLTLQGENAVDYLQYKLLRTGSAEELSDLFGDDAVVLSNVANQCRKMAKTVNFLICYVGSARSLAVKLGLPIAFCERLFDRVFRTYPRLKPWQNEVIQFAKEHGYVQTAYGTRKHVKEAIWSRDGGISSREERRTVNGVVQPTAADILKVVLTETHLTNLWQETDSYLLAAVYDELFCSVPRGQVFEFCQRLQDIMNLTPPGHAIPMLAEVSVGNNWHEMVELGDRPAEQKFIEAFEDLGR